MGRNFARFALLSSAFLAACSSTSQDNSGTPSATSLGSPTTRGDSADIADSLEALPACDGSRTGRLGWAFATHRAYVCTDGTWTPVVVNAAAGSKGATGFGGAPGENGQNGALGASGPAGKKGAQGVKGATPDSGTENVPILTRQSDENPGGNCRYSGVRIESGFDRDMNQSLADEEISSTLYLCESTIAKLARAQFQKNVHSVAILVSTYLDGSTPRSFAGSGFIGEDGIVVTNAHVVDKVVEGTYKLQSITAYFPKASISSDVLLERGLPHYVRSASDFDSFAVETVDRTPTENMEDTADLAFLKVDTRGRPPLSIRKTDERDKPPPAPPDELFGIHYAQAHGPRLSLFGLFQLSSCASWMRGEYGSGASEMCTTHFKVTPDAIVLNWSGYADHGASGSPVFDRFGEVIGIHTWGGKSDIVSDYGAGQSAAVIRHFLSQPRKWKGLSE